MGKRGGTLFISSIAIMHFPYRAKNSFFSSLTQTKDTNNHYNHWSFYNKMKARFLCFLVFLLHILSLVCVSSRPFLTANDGHALVNQGGGALLFIICFINLFLLISSFQEFLSKLSACLELILTILQFQFLAADTDRSTQSALQITPSTNEVSSCIS